MRHPRQHPTQIAQINAGLRWHARHSDAGQVQIGGGDGSSLLARQVNRQIQRRRSKPRCVSLRARRHLGDRLRQVVVERPLLGSIGRHNCFGLGASTSTPGRLASLLCSCGLQNGLELKLRNRGGFCDLLGGKALKLGTLLGKTFGGSMRCSGLKLNLTLSLHVLCRQTLPPSLSCSLSHSPTLSQLSGCGLQQGLPLACRDGGGFSSLFSSNALKLGCEAITFGLRCGLAFGVCNQTPLVRKPCGFSSSRRLDKTVDGCLRSSGLQFRLMLNLHALRRQTLTLSLDCSLALGMCLSNQTLLVGKPRSANPLAFNRRPFHLSFGLGHQALLLETPCGFERGLRCNLTLNIYALCGKALTLSLLSLLSGLAFGKRLGDRTRLLGTLCGCIPFTLDPLPPNLGLSFCCSLHRSQALGLRTLELCCGLQRCLACRRQFFGLALGASLFGTLCSFNPLKLNRLQFPFGLSFSCGPLSGAAINLGALHKRQVFGFHLLSGKPLSFSLCSGQFLGKTLTPSLYRGVSRSHLGRLHLNH